MLLAFVANLGCRRSKLLTYCVFISIYCISKEHYFLSRNVVLTHLRLNHSPRVLTAPFQMILCEGVYLYYSDSRIQLDMPDRLVSGDQVCHLVVTANLEQDGMAVVCSRSARCRSVIRLA